MTGICSVKDCNRVGRIRLGYCDAHYQRLYFNNEVDDSTPLRKRAPRGEALNYLLNSLSATTSECIIWPYSRDSKNYGSIFYQGKRVKAHRLALILKTGIIPSSTDFACHTCDNSLCMFIGEMLLQMLKIKSYFKNEKILDRIE